MGKATLVFDDIIAEVGDDFRCGMQVLLTLLEAVSEHFEGEVTNAYAYARVFWHSGGEESALVAHRVACWQFLAQIKETPSPSTVVGNAVRSLICVMYVETEYDDVGDTVWCFLEFMQEAGVRSENLVGLLRGCNG